MTEKNQRPLGKAWKILLVDDEKEFLDIAKTILEKIDKDLQVETTDSAEKAIQLLKKRGYDAIVSDYKMPWMTGTEFLKKVRESKKEIPFIMLTGRGSENIAIEAINLGSDRYIKKEGKARDLFENLVDEIIQAINEKEKPSTEKLIAWVETKSFSDLSLAKYDLKNLAKKTGFDIKKIEVHESPFNPESGEIIKAYTESFDKIPKNKSGKAAEWKEKIMWDKKTIDADAIIEEKDITEKTQFLLDSEKTKWEKFSIKELAE